jgi:hypothetical protein
MLDVARIQRRQIGVKVARLGIGICPGISAHRLVSTILRSAWVDSQPVTISHVVGSAVASTTSVRKRPPSVRADQKAAFAVARIADGRVSVAQELLGLLGRDPARAELVERDVGREQLVDRRASHAEGLHGAADGPTGGRRTQPVWDNVGTTEGPQTAAHVRAVWPFETADLQGER